MALHPRIIYADKKFYICCQRIHKDAEAHLPIVTDRLKI